MKILALQRDRRPQDQPVRTSDGHNRFVILPRDPWDGPAVIESHDEIRSEVHASALPNDQPHEITLHRRESA